MAETEEYKELAKRIAELSGILDIEAFNKHLDKMGQPYFTTEDQFKDWVQMKLATNFSIEVNQ